MHFVPGKIGKIILIFFAVAIVGLIVVQSPKTQFILGGAFINLGYRFQDHIEDTSNSFPSDLNQMADDLFEKNFLASKVRSVFPRSVHHPKTAILTCMDARLDTVEITGDTRRNYYTLRTAGSSLLPIHQEMLELAVNNGVKLIVLTTHTDCAAEKIAKDFESRRRYPKLAEAVLDRDKMMSMFLARPIIAQKIAENELKVVQAVIDTNTGKMDVARGDGN